MGQLGELFPGPKVRREATDAGTGEDYEETGPLDLTAGAIRLRPRPKPAPQPESTDSTE